MHKLFIYIYCQPIPRLTLFIFLFILLWGYLAYTGIHLFAVVIVLPILVYLVAAAIDMIVDLFLNPVELALLRSLNDYVLKRLNQERHV